MTRTITTAAEHVCTTHCEQGRGHYPAPAVPMVSDAAVEAAALVLANLWGAPGVPDVYRTEARAALSAALPFLGAAPSATREDVEAALTGIGEAFTLDDGTTVIPVGHVRDALLAANLAITPRTDR